MQQSTSKQHISFDYENQSECFTCKKGGILQICQSCPRTYHEMCNQLSLNQQKKWTCYACKPERECQFCKKPILVEKNEINCTICLSPAHAECYWLPKSYQESKYILMEQDGPQDFVENQPICQNSSYVCKQCFGRQGIREIVKTQRIFISKNFITDEYMIALVQVNYKSPVHFGWFTESDARQVFKKFKQNQKNTNKVQKKLKKPQIVSLKPVISKLLKIHIPKFEGNTESQIEAFQKLKNVERGKVLKYCSKENFKFLVKWANSQYDKSTWQDEFTVKSLDKNKSLQKFIKRNGSSIDLTSIDGNKDNQYLKQQIFVNMNNKELEIEPIAKMCQYKWLYPVEIIINNEDSQKMVLSEYLKTLSFIQEQNQSFLVITLEKNIKKWQQSLQLYAKQLQVVSFNGTSQSLQLIKDLQFKKINNRLPFDVLIITYEKFKSQKEFLLSRMQNIGTIILGDFKDPQFVQHLYNNDYKMKSRVMFIINRGINTQPNTQNSLISNICKMYTTPILKHTLSWSQIGEVSTKHIAKNEKINGQKPIDNQTQKFYAIKKYPFSELKRLIFLNHVLKFGFSKSNLDQLHNQIYVEENQGNNGKSKSGKAFFKKYVRAFLAYFTLYKDFTIPQKIKNYFIFDLDQQSVMKRVIRLTKLREIIQKEKEDCQLAIQPTPLRDIHSKSYGDAPNWNYSDDKILIHLILEEGYGEWEKISTRNNWSQFSIGKVPTKTNFSFGFYLRLKFIKNVELKELSNIIVNFISDRSEAIFEHLGTCL